MGNGDAEKSDRMRNAKKSPCRILAIILAGLLLCIVLLCLLLAQRREKTDRTGKTAVSADEVAADAVIADEREDIADADGAFLPEWIEWHEKEITIPAAAAGNEDRTAVLTDKRVRLGQWESPENCLIQDMLVCDIDSDGENELLLLLWKIGTNIDLRLWNEKSEEKWGQHIYIFDILEDTVKPIWWASDIGLTARSWEFNEKRRLIIHELSGKESCWDWDSFGLKLRTGVSFMATGDLIIHKAIYDYGLRSEEGFSFLFDEIRSDMEETDVNICQEETVLVTRPEEYSTFPRFGSPAEVGEEIIRSGFDVVELATNHMLDKGYEAVDFTTGLYDDNNVMYIGAQPSSKVENEPYKILERQGIRFALFNYTFSTNGQPIPGEYPHMVHTLSDEERVKEELLQGRDDSDFVIVFVHWGTEYDRDIDDFQKKWTDIFMDCGAGVVVGSHPHVLQKMELIRKDDRTMLCYYSLGNLISTMDDEDCRVGGLAKFTVIRTSDGCRLAGYELKEINSGFEYRRPTSNVIIKQIGRDDEQKQS